MTKTHLLAAGVLACLSAVAAWGDCRSYSGTVYWHGPSGGIYINTPVWACIADADGKCDAKGGFLLLQNSSRKTVYWSSLAAGEGVQRPLSPGAMELKYLPIYRSRGEELKADLTVTVCE